MQNVIDILKQVFEKTASECINISSYFRYSHKTAQPSHSSLQEMKKLALKQNYMFIQEFKMFISIPLKSLLILPSRIGKASHLEIYNRIFQAQLTKYGCNKP